MLNRFVLANIVVLLLAAATIAQEPAVAKPEPTPAPKPAVKRRTFDQFDLSNGIGRSNSAAPSVTEFVDQQTFDGIAHMVKYAAQIESEFRSTDGVIVDSSHYFAPYNTLSRKLPALFRIMEMFRAGLLEQPVLTNPANVGLLNENQQLLSEMQMIANSSEAQIARNQPKALALAEKYGAPTYPVEKRPLLNAMFERMNGNFTRLMRQVSLRK